MLSLLYETMFPGYEEFVLTKDEEPNRHKEITKSQMLQALSLSCSGSEDLLDRLYTSVSNKPDKEG